MKSYSYTKSISTFLLALFFIGAPAFVFAKTIDLIPDIANVTLSTPVIETSVGNSSTATSNDTPQTNTTNATTNNSTSNTNEAAQSREPEIQSPTNSQNYSAPVTTAGPVVFKPTTVQAVTTNAAATSTATSTASSTFQGTGVAGSVSSQNIYLSSSHLKPAVTRTFLQLALVLGVLGVVLIEGRIVRGAVIRVWG